MFTLVAGTGYTGKRVLERLPADSVAGISRTRIETDRPFEQYDIASRERVSLDLPERFAILYTSPPVGHKDFGPLWLLDALPHAPARFVYISTTGVYGDCGGATVTESHPVDLSSTRSKPRISAERYVSGWAEQHECEHVILRVPGIYGPGRLGIDRLEEGGAVLREEDANPGNRIHVDDLVDCCISALDDRVPSGIYNVGDGDHRSSTWFSDEVARQAGLPEPRKISRAEAEKEFSPMRLAFLSSSRRVDTTKMREVLGVKPRTPEQGIRDSLTAEQSGL